MLGWIILPRASAALDFSPYPGQNALGGLKEWGCIHGRCALGPACRLSQGFSQSRARGLADTLQRRHEAVPSKETIPSSLPVSWVRRLPSSRPCQEGLGLLCKPSLVWEAQARDAEAVAEGICSAQPRCCARCGTGAVGSQGPVCVCPAGKRRRFPQVIVSASLPRHSEFCFVCSGNQRFVKTRCWANPPPAPRAQTSWGLAALSLLPLQPPQTARSRLQVLTYTQSRATAHCGWQPGLYGHVVPGGHASGASVVLCHVQSPGGNASPGGESILAPSLLQSHRRALETLLQKGAPFTARFAVAPVHELIHWGNNKIRL